MLEDRSLVVVAVVGVVVVEEAVVVGNRWEHTMVDKLASEEEEVVGNRWEHTMVDKLASEEEEVAALRVVDNSLGHRLGRTFACMAEDREVGVGVAQVAEEVWRDQVRSGGVVPSALVLEGERMVEDTLVQLHRKQKIKYLISFISKMT